MATTPEPKAVGTMDRTARSEALVLCGGRHAAEVIDALIACGTQVHGCLDAALSRGTEVYPGVTVVGSDDDLPAFVSDGFANVYLGIGGFANLDSRIRLFHQLQELGVPPQPLVHPSAHVSPSAKIGIATTILAHASVGPLSSVGCNCVLTQASVITHHCHVGDHVVLAPNATLAAGVTVGEMATVGMGVTVFHDVTIGRRSVIVSGIHLMQDVPNDSVVKHRTLPAVTPR